MSGNSTSLYSTSTSNITLSSNNLTTLYPGTSGTVTPAQPYGNANVVGLLAAGTDGANTVTNIVATGNITTTAQISATGNITTAGYFLGTFAGNISGNLTVPGSNTQVIYNNNGNAGASSGFTFDSAANLLTVAGNVTGGNVSTVGNVTGAYILGNGSQLTGIAAVYGNANVSNFLANFGSNVISTTGNINGGNVNGTNLYSTGVITAAGNITGSYILGNGSQLTGLPATYSNANVTTLLANFGSNTISTTGNITGGVFSGNGAGLTNLAGGNVTGQVANALVAGTVYTAAQPNITSVGTLTSLSTSGNINAAGSISAVGNVTGGFLTTSGASGNILGVNYVNANFYVGNGSLLTGITASSSNTAVTVTGNAQPNITSVGILTTINTSGAISATGNIQGNVFIGNGAGLTNIDAGNIVGAYGNANVAANLAAFANNPISTSGNITAGYFLGNGSQLTGITTNAAGANTQIQYNNGNAFAGNSLMTFDNTTGNVTLANLVIGTNTAGNVEAGGNAVRINPVATYSGVNGNITALTNSQMIIGSGAGNLSPLAMGTIIRSSQLAMFNVANVVEVANAGGVRYSSLGIGGALQIGNLTNANTVLRALASSLNIGGGPSANVMAPSNLQGINQITAFQGVITVGNVGGTQPNVGNVTLNGVIGTTGLVQVNAGGTANNVAAVNAQIINAGNIQTAVGVVAQLTGTSSLVTPVNAYGFYMPTVQAINGMSNGNAMRAATNYYFLYNADAVAQTQLGSLRSYNEFRYDTATTGNITINKNNAQVQYIAPTANVIIDGYANMVTTLSDSVNTDQEIDTLTILVQQGATPYTVTLPTGSIYQYAGNISTVPAVANSRSILTVVAANISGTVNYFTTVSSDQEIASSYGNANVANFLATGFGSNTISTTGNITGAYFLGNGSQLTGLPATYSDANVTTLLASFGSNSISTTGNVTASYLIGNGSLLSSITGANVTGTVANATYATSAGTATSATTANTVTDAAQPNITSVGTLTSVTSTGNVTGGNILTGGAVSATGNITANYYIGNGSQLTGITTNAAGANTQIQYNNSGAFAGNALMTFDNVTGNVTVANLIIGTSFSGNVEAGGNAVRINPIGTYTGANGNITSLTNSQIVIGNAAGNLSALALGAQIRSSQLIMYNVADVVEVANAGGVRYSSLGVSAALQIGNLTNANSIVRGITSGVNVGGGPSANVFAGSTQGIGVITAYQGIAVLGNVGGTQPNVGNVTVSGTVGTSGFVQVNAGATANNAAGLFGALINSGNITNAFGVTTGFTGTPLTTPTNVFGYYMPNNSSTYGTLNQNGMRAATNYYFLRNDDAVAQNQLGSLRAYHTFQALGNTTGTWNIDKTNGQVQAVSLTGNVTIGSYTNFVTTANDSVNNDTQSDTVTLIIEQGATPYTVTMPTGNASIKYANGTSNVTSTANTTTMIAITAFRTAANATGYLTTISPAFS